MSALVQPALILASAALMLLIMAAVKFLGRRYEWSAELQRKCVHVATGVYALTLPLTFSETWPVLVLLILVCGVMLVLRLPRFAKTGLGATLYGVERKSYGELLLALSVGFIFYFSIGKPILYVLPIAVLTLSDAAAALIGTRYGRKHFAVEAGTKSLEGVAMFFLVTWIVAMIALLLLTDIGRLNVVLLSVVVAAFGALVEADSWRGFDNLFVPVGIHLLLTSYLDTSPQQLLLLAGIITGALLAVMTLAPRLGLSNHAARAYTVLVFLICAVTAPHNAILPLAAVFAHVAARSARPCKSPYPDLDLLAAVAGVALFWLFLGEYLARNSLNVYNLTFAGAALIFIALAAGRRLVLIAPAAGILFAGVLIIAGRNPEYAQWHGALWPWIAASFALCLLIPVVRPDLLDNYRAPRALALALVAPLALFATGVFAS
jgi:phytol kinase